MTILVALVAGLVGWTVAGPLLGVPLRVKTSPGGPTIDVAIASVAIAGLVVGLAGWGLLVLLGRVTSNPRRVWTVVAVVVLLVSFAGPAGGVQTSTVVALTCLHVLVGGILIIGFRRSVNR